MPKKDPNGPMLDRPRDDEIHFRFPKSLREQLEKELDAENKGRDISMTLTDYVIKKLAVPREKKK